MDALTYMQNNIDDDVIHINVAGNGSILATLLEGAGVSVNRFNSSSKCEDLDKIRSMLNDELYEDLKALLIKHFRELG